MNCPACNRRAVFIRDRGFKDGSGRVFICCTKGCKNYMLYIYPKEPEYRCVMKPKKPKVLKAEHYEIKCEAITFENFTIDKRGRKTRGKIRCTVPGKIISIKKVK